MKSIRDESSPMYNLPPRKLGHREPAMPRTKNRQPQSRRLAALVGALTLLTVAAVYINITYVRRSPTSGHIQRGIALYTAGNAAEAEREWTSALRHDPKRLEPYQLLSHLYMETGRPELAVPLLEHLRKTAPASAHTFCSLAEAYARTERPTDGMEVARQAVEIEPDCHRAHALLGIHLADQKEFRGGIQHLQKAVALAPGDDKTALSLAQAQMDAADFSGAEKTARSVISRNTSSAMAHYLLGLAYARRAPLKENMEIASRAFAEAVKRDPSLTGALAELGRMRLLAGDNRGAIEALEQLWKQGTRDKDIAFNLASAYRKAGDAASAAKMSAEYKRLTDFEARYAALEKRASLDPTNTDIAIQIAEMEMEAGRPEEALPLVNSVLRDRPGDPRALKLLGTINSRTGQAGAGTDSAGAGAAAEATGKADTNQHQHP